MKVIQIVAATSVISGLCLAESPPVFAVYDSSVCYSLDSFAYDITAEGGGTITATYLADDPAAAAGLGLDASNDVMWSIPAPPDPSKWLWDTSSTNGQLNLDIIDPDGSTGLTLTPTGTFENDFAALSDLGVPCASLNPQISIGDPAPTFYIDAPAPVTVTGGHQLNLPSLTESSANLYLVNNGSSWNGETIGSFVLPRGGYCVNYNSTCLVAVPEPSSAILATLALGGIAASRRRRRSA